MTAHFTAKQHYARAVDFVQYETVGLVVRHQRRSRLHGVAHTLAELFARTANDDERDDE